MQQQQFRLGHFDRCSLDGGNQAPNAVIPLDEHAICVNICRDAWLVKHRIGRSLVYRTAMEMDYKQIAHRCQASWSTPCYIEFFAKIGLKNGRLFLKNSVGEVSLIDISPR